MMFGGYQKIEGGFVDEALADLTNGAPDRYYLDSDEIKDMLNSG
jgi:hypothetical protein